MREDVIYSRDDVERVVIVTNAPQAGNLPCVHGNVCREYWDKYHVIISNNCPNSPCYKPLI